VKIAKLKLKGHREKHTVPYFVLDDLCHFHYYSRISFYSCVDKQMIFDEYMAIAAKKGDISFDESWGQGRSVFGGLTAAVVLKRIESESHQLDRNLRSVHVNFCGPVNIDAPCSIQVSILSNSRSVIQIQGALIQDGETKTHLIACFANGRPSGVSVTPPHKSFDSVESELAAIPFLPGVTPNMVQHLNLRPDNGIMPFSGSDRAEVSGWMSFKDTLKTFDDCALLALIDGWPPAVLPLLKRPAPASTITWNIEFIQPREIQENPTLYYDCHVRQGEEGYSHTIADIYNEDGALIAMSRQLVGVYDQRSQSA